MCCLGHRPCHAVAVSLVEVRAVRALTVGDYDEPARTVRLRASTTKTRAALWVELPDVLADALEANLPPRGSRRDGSAVPRRVGRSAADSDRPRLSRCRCPGVLATRSPTPEDLAFPSPGALMGGDRAFRRAAQAVDHSGHLHARALRWERDRLCRGGRRASFYHWSLLRTQSPQERPEETQDGYGIPQPIGGSAVNWSSPPWKLCRPGAPSCGPFDSI